MQMYFSQNPVIFPMDSKLVTIYTIGNTPLLEHSLPMHQCSNHGSVLYTVHNGAQSYLCIPGAHRHNTRA